MEDGLLTVTYNRRGAMPLGKGVRYRFVKGTHERLAFRGDKVIEAKNTDTGATHTEAEFAADREKKEKAKGQKKHLMGSKD